MHYATIPRCGIRLICSATASLGLALTGLGADHRDGPKFITTGSQLGALDLNDLFIFQSPTNSAKTVLIMTVSPFAGVLTPVTFDPQFRYEIMIDRDLDELPDLILRSAFSEPTSDGAQTATLTARRFGRRTLPLAEGAIGTNISFGDGGQFRAANHDDPFFFDAIGYQMFSDDGEGIFPRPVGAATNFFGPNVNTLAIIIEMPTRDLLLSADRPQIRAWTRTINAKDRQVDRAGQPFLNQFLIPPLPGNDTSRGDRRDLFNLGTPAADFRRFREDVIAVLTGFWGNSPGRAGALVDRFLLPNVITFDTSLTWEPERGGFPNGRRLRDDVGDYILNLVSDGRIPTDNVSDDNGDRITDGSQRPDGSRRAAAFPYLGPPNPVER